MAEGDVVIRLRDVYDITQRTEQKVELLILSVANIEKLTTDHEGRIRNVEKRLYALPSIATLIAAAALVVAILSLTHGTTPLPTRSTSAPQAAAQAPVVTVPATVPITAAPAATQPRSVPTTLARHRHASPPATSPVLPPVTVTAPTTPSSLVQALESLTGRIGVRLP